MKERETETGRQTEVERDRDKQTDRQREGGGRREKTERKEAGERKTSDGRFPFPKLELHPETMQTSEPSSQLLIFGNKYTKAFAVSKIFYVCLSNTLRATAYLPAPLTRLQFKGKCAKIDELKFRKQITFGLIGTIKYHCSYTISCCLKYKFQKPSGYVVKCEFSNFRPLALLLAIWQATLFFSLQIFPNLQPIQNCLHSHSLK